MAFATVIAAVISAVAVVWAATITYKAFSERASLLIANLLLQRDLTEAEKTRDERSRDLERVSEELACTRMLLAVTQAQKNDLEAQVQAARLILTSGVTPPVMDLLRRRE